MRKRDIKTFHLAVFYAGLTLVVFCAISCRRISNSSAPEEPGRTQPHKLSAPLAGPYAVGAWDTTKREKFGRLLQEYLGAAYQGASKYQEGLDCSRFTSEVYRRFDGLRLPRVARDQARTGQEVSRSHLRYGDLVFFAIGGKAVSHVGIYVGDGRFIHASSSRGVVIDKMNSSYWRKRYHSSRRVVFAKKNKSKKPSPKGR